MKSRFILFRRNGVFYAEDTTTRKQTSLRTRDEAEATTLLNAKNESFRQPVLNLHIARAYLTAADPAMGQRTWSDVMAQMQTHGKESTQTRCTSAMQSKAFDAIRSVRLVETTAEQFLAILNKGKVSVVHYLRRLHNLALSLGWLAVPVLAPRLWPKLQFKPKRGITFAEHQRIITAKKNAERSLYYQTLWEIGSAQSDAAALIAENIDWQTRTLTYFRMKTGERAQLTIGTTLQKILNQLPTSGPLFPKISTSTDKARSAEFCRRCKLLGIEGVSLHSYATDGEIDSLRARLRTKVPQGHFSTSIHISLGNFLEQPNDSAVAKLKAYVGGFCDDRTILGHVNIPFLSYAMYKGPFIRMTLKPIFRTALVK